MAWPGLQQFMQPNAVKIKTIAQALQDAPQTRRWSKAVIKPALEAVISALLVRLLVC